MSHKWTKIITSLCLSMCMAFGLCCFTGQTAATDVYASPETAAFDIDAADYSPEFVGQLNQAQNADQLCLVAVTGGTTACVSMHQKDENGDWKRIMKTKGYIGMKGLGKEREGDYKTPVGTYRFDRAFGISEDPGCKGFEYHKVTGDDYWSGDRRDGYQYNRMVSIKDYPNLNKHASEHLIGYTMQYQYCLNISWNEECKPGKGSAIFLHCFGTAPYTAGCVAISKEKMIKVLQNVDEDCVVVIDYLGNIRNNNVN